MRARDWPIAVLAILAVLVVTVTRTTLGDYTTNPAEDNAAPTLTALAHGDFDAASDAMPAMGLTSILLRLPVIRLGGGDPLLVYKLGSLVCLLGIVVLVVLLDRRMREQGRSILYRAVLAVTLAAGPAAYLPLNSGHPEEIVGGVLCVGAVLAAERRNAVAAGVLLGLALGTKQWALLAIPCVLIPVAGPRILDRRRITATLTAVGVAALMIVPPIAANPSRYHASTSHLASTKRTYVQSVWWPIAEKVELNVDLGGGEHRRMDVFRLRGPLRRGNTTAIAVLAAFIVGLVGLRRGRLRDPMLVLAGLMTLRCAIDPMNLGYYATPAILAYAAWEASPRAPASRVLPIATLAASAVVSFAWRFSDQAPHALVWMFWLLAPASLALLRPEAGSELRSGT